MVQQLYKDAVRAERVTAAALQGLATPSRSVTTYTERHLSIAPETLAGATAILWSKYWSQDNELLHQRAVELVEVPCQQHGIAIQVLGEYPLFTNLKLVRGSISDVVIVPADQDPLIVNGNFPLPQKVRHRLRAMERAGVPFDMMYTYIAHEVPRGSISEHGPIPLEVILPSAPVETRRTSERLGKIAYTAQSSLLGLLGLTARASALGLGAVSAGAGMALEALLDPLIFGAIADERGIATWFVLAQWAW
jgi:hypothetical protein